MLKRKRIVEGIEYVEPESMKNFSACAGMILTGAAKILVDTNMGMGETDELILSERPDYAIISHYHLDHMTWGQNVNRHSKAELLVPAEEVAYIESLDRFVEMTAAPLGLSNEWETFSREVSGFSGLENYSAYDGSLSFDLGKFSLKTVKTPGHSPGHSSFYIPEQRILFTGDMGVDRFGPWYGWNDCDLALFVQSVLALREMEVDLLLTSHGGIVGEKINEIWNKVLRQILENEKKVIVLLERGLGREDAALEGLVYKGVKNVPEPMNSFLKMWDAAIFDHHSKILSNCPLRDLFPELKNL
jgi:hydroxyacylglutathione hydrolase